MGTTLNALKRILRTIFDVDQHAPLHLQAAGWFAYLLLAYGTSLILGVAVLSYTLGTGAGNERSINVTPTVSLS